MGDASYIVDNNVGIRNSREFMRSAVLLGVLGNCVGSARTLATVRSANMACENWVLAFETAMERSLNSEDQYDDTNFLFPTANCRRGSENPFHVSERADFTI